ncbi:MAG: 16S rRNA (adenine(1518)-N(6)/adenine(1519)-N(6))-dimethyltransferase RsmA [Bacillota bacterium]|nr:16S rRNA (adenine(1518)-N(6)/adenine(1519)-N(6))-dimethyltransferase RsmA [Bacillota bacterium]
MNEEAYFDNIRSYKFLTKKEIGQNFLIDPEAAKRIVDALDLSAGEKAIEIGSGAGSLSFFLAEKNTPVDLIDIDEGLIVKLKQDFEGKGNVNVIQSNALKHDFSPYEKVIGNLPYYITSGIVERVFLNTPKLKKAVFMVQKEAAARLLAEKGSEDYTPLSLYLSYVSHPKRLFNVGRNSFVPAPHVDSTVIEFSIIPEHYNGEAKAMYQLAKAVFLNRRKTIYNNLKNHLGDAKKAEEALAKAGISPSLRPEQLSPEEFITLLRSVE